MTTNSISHNDEVHERTGCVPDHRAIQSPGPSVEQQPEFGSASTPDSLPPIGSAGSLVGLVLESDGAIFHLIPDPGDDSQWPNWVDVDSGAKWSEMFYVFMRVG